MLFLFLYVCLYKWQYCSAKYIINWIVNNLVRKRGLNKQTLSLNAKFQQKKRKIVISRVIHILNMLLLFPVAAARPLPVTFLRGNI